MTELLRRLVDEQLAARRGVTGVHKEAVLRLIDLGASGVRHTSARHDAALDEALRASRAESKWSCLRRASHRPFSRHEEAQ